MRSSWARLFSTNLADAALNLTPECWRFAGNNAAAFRFQGTWPGSKAISAYSLPSTWRVRGSKPLRVDVIAASPGIWSGRTTSLLLTDAAEDLFGNTPLGAGAEPTTETPPSPNVVPSVRCNYLAELLRRQHSKAAFATSQAAGSVGFSAMEWSLGTIDWRQGFSTSRFTEIATQPAGAPFPTNILAGGVRYQYSPWRFRGHPLYASQWHPLSALRIRPLQPMPLLLIRCDFLVRSPTHSSCAARISTPKTSTY